MKNFLKKCFTKKNLKEFAVVNFTLLMLAFIYSFLMTPNHIVLGGLSSLSLFLCDILKFKYLTPSSLMLIINIILLILSYIFVNQTFFFKTLYCAIVYPLFSLLFESLYQLPAIQDFFPTLTTTGDYLLVVVLSSLGFGWSIGTALKYGASTGGFDIIEKILLKCFHISPSISIFILDGIVILCGSFFGVGNTIKPFFRIIFGLLYVVICGQVVDAIVFSGFNVRSVTILTSHVEEVKTCIYRYANRGVTEVQAWGGYKETPMRMLVCVMSNNEYYKIRPMVERIDPAVFMYTSRASEVFGIGFSTERVRASWEKPKTAVEDTKTIDNK
jgi:uncharacterized membrane-anchored protein YitT (DUF2179 family)